MVRRGDRVDGPMWSPAPTVKAGTHRISPMNQNLPNMLQRTCLGMPQAGSLSMGRSVFWRFDCSGRALAIVVFVQPEKTGIILKSAAFGRDTQRRTLLHVLPHCRQPLFGNVAIYGNAQVLSETVRQGRRGNARGLGNDIQLQLFTQIFINVGQRFLSNG